MKKVSKVSLGIFLSLSILVNSILFPLVSFASNNVISTKAVYPDQKVDSIVKNIEKGNKLSQDETFFAEGEGIVDGRYTVFIKKNSKKKLVTELRSISSTDTVSEYGDVVAIPINISDEKERERTLENLEKDGDVIAVTQVARRTPSAVSAPNDPLYPPAGNFTNSYQWNLNQSASGNYGIDLLRAWQYIDSQAVAWQGDPNLTVAIIDTGLAYEVYNDKYDNETISWDFGKASDVSTNMFVNDDEVADNGVDDDTNGSIEDTFEAPFDALYCLDNNGNGQCDSPSERTKSYIDDVNGINFIDFYNYWEPYQVSSASNCSNAPYTSYKCVQQKYCDVAGTTGSSYWGCVPREMGHPNDLMGHGTAVTGIIASAVNNSIAGTGIAPGVKILPIGIFGFVYSSGEWVYDPNSGSADYVARAVEYAVDQGVNIINMSFGGTIPDAYEELAIARAYEDDGVLIVAATGNRSSSTIDYPAKYSSVIAVGAVNKDGSRVSYSNYGSGMEVVAPVGSGIPVQSYACYFTTGDYDNKCLTTSITPSVPSQFTQFSNGLSAGTSFASPQAVGVAALIWSLHPTWSNEQVRYVLKMSSTASANYTSTLGYGIINAYNAVRAVDSAGNDLTQTGRIFQSVRGADNTVNTRYSDDHMSTLSAWSPSLATNDEVSMVYSSNHQRLVQVIRTTGNKIYVRNSTNFGGTWSSWGKLGYTLGKVTLVDTGTNLVMAMRGTDNTINTRVSTDGGVRWEPWRSGGLTYGTIDLAYDPASSRVVLAAVNNSGLVSLRYSTNHGVSWSSWYGNGYAYGSPRLVVAGNRVILAVRTRNNAIGTRYTTNGGTSWSSWLNSEYTLGDVEMVFTGSHVVQSVRGSNDVIMTRYSKDLGSSWSIWKNKSGQTRNNITMVYDSQVKKIVASVRGLYGGAFTRYSLDNGKTWTGWSKSGETLSAVELLFVGTANW